MMDFFPPRLLLAVTVAILLAPAAATAADSRWSIDFEGGVAVSGYNDVRIPGNTGTLFSLSQELDSDPAFFWRARLTRSLGQRHHLSLLVAPLRLESAGRIDRSISFNGEKFDANTPLDAGYRFDSYRLTYIYDLHRSDRIRLGIGFTGKIRDAAITLSGGGNSAEKSNTGFVPLLHLVFHWQFSKRTGLLVEGDGLAAPQGRAEDFLLAFTADLSPRLGFKAGYRLLEGGADNDEVYTFTLVHYASAGIVFRL
ncbi:MAG: hypothetical protein JSW34_03965 [Candidatus Zixiibacteriota bacterium]|nr:MAG: hypothetical protein JSW34_03965 [candidate division Zixibacteria bacterium]